jgi:hypothetical protein
VKRLHQVVLIGSTVLASWLGMQAVHECGHVFGAWLTGGEVDRVVLHPLTISRTDLARNPDPLLVVWAGPIFGVLFPLALWGTAAALRMPGSFVLRFFAGFCLIANGAYIAVGSFGRVGDCGEMLRHGSQMWQLWFFGAITIPVGIWLWHRQGTDFGLGSANGAVDLRVAYGVLVGSLLLVVLGLSFGGE